MIGRRQFFEVEKKLYVALAQWKICTHILWGDVYYKKSQYSLVFFDWVGCEQSYENELDDA